MHFMRHVFPGDAEVDLRRVLPREHAAEQMDAGPVIAVGRYRIGMAVSDGLKLLELSEKECQETGANPQNQTLLHVPAASFLGLRWKVIVGAVGNTVVSLKATTSTETITETIQAFTLVQEYCSERLGVPEERKPENPSASGALKRHRWRLRRS